MRLSLTMCLLCANRLVSCELVFAEEELYFKCGGVLVLGDCISGMPQQSGHSFYCPAVAANTRSGCSSR